MPNLDLDVFDPPCLQSIWYRILEDDDGVWWLNTNIRFRSNDAWGANFMNMFGFVLFSKEVIADALRKTLAAMTEEFIEDGATDLLAESVETFLDNWLIKHIEDVDMRFAAFARES